jgi:hypothetical protein
MPICPKQIDLAELLPAARRLRIRSVDIFHYAEALLRWSAAGFPARSRAEARAIYRQHCRPCDQRRGGRCQKCGCRVSAGWFALTNKIKMGTEHCPDRRW